MYKQCKTEQSSDRQRALEQGLLEAMISARFEDITVSGLCARMGIPRKAFYRYFPSKEDALYALIDHSFMDMDLYISQSLASGPVSMLRELELGMEYWKRMSPLIAALEKSELTGVLLQHVFTSSIDNTSLLRKYMAVERPEVRDQTLTFLISGILFLVLQWHQGGYQETPKQMAKTIYRLVTEPLVQPPDGPARI